MCVDKNMITYYKNIPMASTFAPEIHEWIAVYGNQYIFVLKDTDRFSPTRDGRFKNGLYKGTAPVPHAEVPVEIRRKAGQRLGGARIQGQINHFP